MKKQPKTFANVCWRNSWAELSLCYLLTTVVGAHLLDMHWLATMAVAPFAMLATLLGVATLVQLLWMFVVGLEKLGTVVGLRKSPIA